MITESKEDGTTVEYTYGNDLLSDGRHNFLTDALGSTRGLVDSTEQLTDSYDYTPYGELSNHEGTSENNFLFTGEQLDQETDEYYLRARYYSPSMGRFLSRDSYDGGILEPITLNHYLYAGGSPSMHVDPSGHLSILSTGYGIATVAEIYTIPNSLAFIGKRVVKPRLFGMLGAQANMYIPVAMTAYVMSMGLELRNEAIFSISYNIVHGSSRESMDLAYKKYHLAVSLIQSAGLFADGMNSAIGDINAYTGFAKQIANSSRFRNIASGYQNLSNICKAQIYEMVKISHEIGFLRSNAKALEETIGDMNGIILKLIQESF